MFHMEAMAFIHVSLVTAAYIVLIQFILSLLNLFVFILTVLTMEAQADALNQLTTDNLEGKVNFSYTSLTSFFCFKKTKGLL